MVWRPPPRTLTVNALAGVGLADVLAPDVEDFLRRFKGAPLTTSCRRESLAGKKQVPHHCLVAAKDKEMSPLFSIMQDVINARDEQAFAELEKYNIIPMSKRKNRQVYQVIEDKKLFIPSPKRGSRISNLNVRLKVVFVNEIVGHDNPLVPGTHLFPYIIGISCHGGSNHKGGYCIKVGSC